MRQHLYNFMLDMLDICYSASIAAIRWARNSRCLDVLYVIIMIVMGYILVFGGERVNCPIHDMESKYDPWVHQLADSNKKQHIFVMGELLCKEYKEYIGDYLAVYNVAYDDHHGWRSHPDVLNLIYTHIDTPEGSYLPTSRKYIGLFRLEDVSNVSINNMIIDDQQKYCGSVSNQVNQYGHTMSCVCCSFPKEHTMYCYFGDVETYDLIMWITKRLMGSFKQCQEISPLSHYIQSGFDRVQRDGCFLKVTK
jgi:hypothetical protein